MSIVIFVGLMVVYAVQGHLRRTARGLDRLSLVMAERPGEILAHEVAALFPTHPFQLRPGPCLIYGTARWLMTR
jgi:hypothetical protein